MTTIFFYSSIIALLILSSCNKKNNPVVTATIDVSKQWSIDIFGVAIAPLYAGKCFGIKVSAVVGVREAGIAARQSPTTSRLLKKIKKLTGGLINNKISVLCCW